MKVRGVFNCNGDGCAIYVQFIINISINSLINRYLIVWVRLWVFMSMRLCLVTESFFEAGGGLTTFATRLAKSLRRDGISSFVITPDTRRERDDETAHTGLPVYPLPPRGQHPAVKYFFLPVLFLWLLFNRHKYDTMLVAGCRVTGIPSVIVGALLGKPCHLRPAAEGEISGRPFLRHPWVDRVPALRPVVEMGVRLRNKLFNAGAASFVAISDTIEQELLQAGMPQDKIVRISNGIPTTEFSPPAPEVRRDLRNEMDLHSENLHAVYVGTLAPRKRVEVLLQAWARRKSCECEHTLLLVGPARTKGYRDDLVGLTRTLDIQHSVRFVGQVDDVRPFLAAANIFLMASRWEGMSNSLLEAMACGLAPVVTNVSGAGELIEPRVNGLLVPNEDDPVSKFVSSIDRLLHDAQRCAEMGASARRTIEESYSFRDTASAYRDLLCKKTYP